MLPDRVSNPGPLTYESGVLPIALRGPARRRKACPEKEPQKARSLAVSVFCLLWAHFVYSLSNVI